MSTIRRVSLLCASLLFGLATSSFFAASAGASPSGPQIPDIPAAQAAARWLADQQAANGSIGSLSVTVNAILSLAAADIDLGAANRALTYVEANANSYITVDSADGAGQLALLILDAKALGVDPTNFGGTNLVARLLATEQTSGPDAGLYGTEQQLNDYYVGDFDQGLAFDALAAVGQHPDAAAVSWLVNQQCASGGWTIREQSLDSCTYDPNDGLGPDNQTTSIVIQGLAAQGQLASPMKTLALSFYTTGQDADAGWSFYPNSVSQPQQSDSQSTGLAIQALEAMGQSPTSPTFVQGGVTPVAALFGYIIPSGPNAGAVGYQDNVTASALSTNQDIPVLMGDTSPFTPSTASYWVASASGAVFSFGNTAFHGALSGPLNAPIVDIVAAPDDGGYWLVGSDGGVFSFGDAVYSGSTGALKLNKPIVGMASTPDGNGYWLVGSDGGVFAFGDAVFHGSTGSLKLNQPIVGMAATPDGGGYWLVASDGGVFAFGDAVYHGSTGSLTLNKPIVGLASSPDGGGYWLVGSDGGIFAFGDATYHGSTGGLKLNNPIVGMAATTGGYWLVASDGGIFNFGSAGFVGSAVPYDQSNVVALAAADA